MQPTLKPPLPTRSHATTRHKGKDISKKPIHHHLSTAFEEDSDPNKLRGDKAHAEKFGSHILVLTLSVSTASVERAFSAMKIVKNKLHNKMGDFFLSDNLVLYIEKDIAETFSLDSALDDFCAKKRRVRFLFWPTRLNNTGFVTANNSQVKFKKAEVEDQHRISSISNKTKSVTACNDSLKSRTSNVIAVCATCGKYMFNLNHDACVSKFLNDVNARTKKPKIVPISTRKPKSQANKSVATPLKKTVVSESTIQKSKSYYRMLYKKTSKVWKWWIEQQCPSGYKWVPKTKMKWVPKVRKEDVNTSISPTIDNASRITNIVQLIIFIVDSGCTKHMVGNLKMLCNSVKKYLETTSSTPICFMAKASPTQAWLWHRRLSHLNFDYINLLSKKDIVIGLPKLKYVKDQLCSSCEVSKAKISSFKTKVVPSSKGRLNLLNMDLCGSMRVASINGKKYILVIVDDYSRYTWTLFLLSKDETPEVLKDFLKTIQRNLQAQASDYDNSGPAPQLQNVSPLADTIVPSQQELDLLFGPLYDEFFNDGTSRVNKSSSPTDNSIKKDTLPSTHIQPTSEPTTPTNVHAEENNDNQAEFTNPFCTPVQENAESSSRNIGNSNVHTFNQPQDSKYRWTKDHPLTQVRGNPSKPVQTRRQLATDPEMCMFALTVSIVEPKNIKEAMADSAWIEAMQEELHH
ncbi:retrovirus-related pol polyprotein from transposon TNT 1-94 [Tanacetum coccineum]